MSSFDENPYSAPVTTAPPPQLVSGDIFRTGQFLIIRSGSILPELCPVNAEPVEPARNGYRKPRKLAWVPPWLYLGLLGPLPLLILLVFLQKRGTVTYALGPVAKKRMQNRKLIGTLLLFLSLGVIAALIFLPDLGSDRTLGPVLGLLVGVLFITALVFFIISQPITVAGYRKKGWFKLKGCGPEFLSQFQEVDFKSLS